MRLENTAHFGQIREQNRRIIRNLVRSKSCISKSEIASLTGLTYPTVSSAIKDLVNSGEVTELESISVGGRPGAVFQLNERYQYIICAYIDDLKLFARIYDACGKQCEVVDIADISISCLDIDNTMLNNLKESIRKHIPQSRIPNLHIIPDPNKLYYQGLLNIAMEFCENH